MAKLLITGATGTVGSELVGILKEQRVDFKVMVRSKEKAELSDSLPKIMQNFSRIKI